jgi:hypothetical protein
MMQKALAGTNSGVRVRFMPECPPILGFDPNLAGIDRSPGCEKFNEDVLHEIAGLGSHKLRGVILAARWPSYLRSDAAEAGATIGLRRELAELDRLGLEAVVVLPVPGLPHDAPACLARRDPSQCAVARPLAESKRAQSMHLLSRVVAGSRNAILLDPFEALCSAERCDAISGGKVLYSDAHHLSVNGSVTLAHVASAALRRLRAPAAVASRDLARQPR